MQNTLVTWMRGRRVHEHRRMTAPNWNRYRLRSSDLSHRASNVIAASILLLMTLPFFIVIPILIKLSGPGPIFYAGTRLGKNKQPFRMYKFRTLHPDAERIIGASLLTERHKLTTPVGSFLRDTRLDELPQLFNVIKGDMNLIGPRPERPEIYEDMCRQIPGYDARFAVRPGAIGFAQLFTPHGTPKRLRSLVDSAYLARPRGAWQDLRLLLEFIGLISLKALSISWRVLVEFVRCLRCRHPSENRRELRRVRLADARVFLKRLDASAETPETECTLIDLNKEAILIHCPRHHPLTQVHVRLERWISRRRGQPAKRRIARCEGRILIERGQGPDDYDYVLQVDPISPLNEFKYQKYFLISSIS